MAENKTYTREEQLENLAKEYEEIKERHTKSHEAFTAFKNNNKEFWEVRKDDEKSSAEEYKEVKAEYDELMKESREVRRKRSYLERKITDLASDAFQDITEEVIALQDSIEENKKQIENCDKAIKDAEESLLEYEDDEEFCKQVKANIELAKDSKQSLEKALKDKEDKLKALNLSADELLKKYGRIITRQTRKKETSEKVEETDTPEQKKDEKKEEEKKKDEDTKKQPKQNSNYTPSEAVPATAVDDKSTPSDDKEDLIKEVRGLEYKAKTDRLKPGDAERIAEIMQDPKQFEKLGITTGLFNNKGKTFLKAIAKDTVAKSAATIRNIQKALPDSDIKYKPENGEDVISLNVLGDWGMGIKKVLSHPGAVFDSEEYFEKILNSGALDSITGKTIRDGEEIELKELLAEDIRSCMKQYELFRNATSSYKTAKAERKKNGLFGKRKGDTEVKPLPAGTDENKQPSKMPLLDQVVPQEAYEDPFKDGRTTKTKERTKEI